MGWGGGGVCDSKPPCGTVEAATHGHNGMGPNLNVHCSGSFLPHGEW
jgi:hypothetical protein